jgi:hypothetical protein
MFVIQVIRKQWDKGQLTEKVKVEPCLPVVKEFAYFAFNKRCIVDIQGDNRLNKPINLLQIENGWVQIDRLLINLNSKEIKPKSDEHIQFDSVPTCFLDPQSLRFEYQWRYKVFEGGYYYWLYEHSVINAIYDEAFDENTFMNNEPKMIITNQI